MPNYVYQKFFVSGDKGDLENFLNKVFTDDELDFNNIIPEPTRLEECPKEFILSPDNTFVKPLEDRPWFNWYFWRLNNWQTKWNCCDTNYYFETDKKLVIAFETAWSPVINLVFEITKRFPSLKFRYFYLDESEEFCGKIVRNRKGEYTHYEYCYSEKLQKEAGF